MIFDSALLPPDEAVAWLRGVEQLLAAQTTAEIAVAQIGEHTGLHRLPLGPDWRLVDHSWAHLPSVGALLERCAGVRRAELVVQGDSLTAYLTADSTVQPARLHADVLAALPGLRTVVAPHRYII